MTNRSQRCLGELLDEAQFQVSYDEEADRHDEQGQVVLPHAPEGVFDALLLQNLLPRVTAGNKNKINAEICEIC